MLAQLAPRLTETATLATAIGRVALTSMTDVLDRVRRPALVLNREGMVLRTNQAADHGFARNRAKPPRSSRRWESTASRSWLRWFRSWCEYWVCAGRRSQISPERERKTSTFPVLQLKGVALWFADSFSLSAPSRHGYVHKQEKQRAGRLISRHHAFPRSSSHDGFPVAGADTPLPAPRTFAHLELEEREVVQAQQIISQRVSTSFRYLTRCRHLVLYGRKNAAVRWRVA